MESRPRRNPLLILLGVAASCLIPCFGFTWLLVAPLMRAMNAPVPTVPGPEAAGVGAATGGELIHVAEDLAIQRVRLATGERAVVVSADDAWSLHTVAGPDADGSFAGVQESMGQSNWRLVRWDPHGGEAVVDRGTGSPLWQNVIGESLAVRGGVLAWVRDGDGTQFNEPPAYIDIGKLTWQSKPGAEIERSEIPVLDTGLAISPDGKTLYAVRPLSRPELPDPLRNTFFAAGFGAWDPVPVITAIDLATRTETPVVIGWHPVVSDDGRHLLYEDFEGKVAIRSLADGVSSAVTLPGKWGHPIGLKGDRYAVYWALPTAGAPLSRTRNNSPLVGPKPMISIKAVDLRTGAFETLHYPIDPRLHATWGMVDR